VRLFMMASIPRSAVAISPWERWLVVVVFMWIFLRFGVDDSRLWSSPESA
jgi:hypothetical protein